LKANSEFSLLEVTLQTGRTHQIRVHLAHAGHPVLGDDKYGDFELNRAVAKQGVKRLFLHAGRLALTHPLTRQRLRFDAELPQDMRGFVERQFA
jgi:23S rRNA pseudouridine955/2504/2580 synthase